MDRGASVGNGNSYACGNSSYNGGPGSVNQYTGTRLNGEYHWWYIV